MNKILKNVTIILVILVVWAGSRFLQKDSIGAEVKSQITALCQTSECNETLEKKFGNCFNEGFKIFGLPIKAKVLHTCLMENNNKPYLEYNENFIKVSHKKFIL